MSFQSTPNKLSHKTHKISQGMRKVIKVNLHAGLILGQVFWPISYALALPEFISGNGVEAVNDSKTAYAVTDGRAIAHWESFTLSEGNSVSFENKGIKSSILLNVVDGNFGSDIAGELTAKNIQFILINKNGVSIADSARIDVSSLVLSTLGVTKVQEDLFKDDRKSTRLNSSHVRISYAVF